MRRKQAINLQFKRKAQSKHNSKRSRVYNKMQSKRDIRSENASIAMKKTTALLEHNASTTSNKNEFERKIKINNNESENCPFYQKWFNPFPNSINQLNENQASSPVVYANKCHSRCTSIRGIRIHSRQNLNYSKNNAIRPQSGLIDQRKFLVLSSTMKNSKVENTFVAKNNNESENNIYINNSLGLIKPNQNQRVVFNENKDLLCFSDIINENEHPNSILSKISSKEQLNKERFNTKAFDDYVHNYEQGIADKRKINRLKKQLAHEVSATKFHKCVTSWQNHNHNIQNYSYAELDCEMCMQEKLRSNYNTVDKVVYVYTNEEHKLKYRQNNRNAICSQIKSSKNSPLK